MSLSAVLAPISTRLTLHYHAINDRRLCLFWPSAESMHEERSGHDRPAHVFKHDPAAYHGMPHDCVKIIHTTCPCLAVPLFFETKLVGACEVETDCETQMCKQDMRRLAIKTARWHTLPLLNQITSHTQHKQQQRTTNRTANP